MKKILIAFTSLVLSQASWGALAHVSMENYAADKKLFGKFEYSKEYYSGSWEKLQEELKGFSAERQTVVKKLAEARDKSKKELMEKHRALLSSDAQSADPDSKWGREILENLSAQTELKEGFQMAIANWDSKNFVEVRYVEVDSKPYVVRVKIRRDSKYPALAFNVH